MRLSNKLFLLMVAILLFNLLLLMAFGNTFMSAFYLSRTKNDLFVNSTAIASLYNSGDTEEFEKLVTSIEVQNINMLITDKEKQEIIYYSRPIRNQAESGALKIPLEIAIEDVDSKEIQNDARMYKLLEMLRGINIESEPVIIGGSMVTESDDSPLAAITALNDGNLLILETPRIQVQASARLAIVYTFYTSLMTLLIGGFLVFYLSRKATNPILKIQRVAENISKMDFSQKCNVTSNDELGILARSINNMSDKLKENMEQLIRSNEVLTIDLERAKETEKIRKQFIANVSHDFKTPLTLILNYAQNIKSSSGENDEQAEIIINEAEKMNSLIHQLLKLSQLESGMLEAEMNFFPIHEIITNVISNYKIILDKKGIKVKYIPTSEIIVGDYTKLLQVFTNIFENACMHSSGYVKVYTKRSKGLLKISVFNTGKTIPDQDLDNLFTSFYRGDKSRKTSKSYGLGLAIVKAVLDMHKMKYGVLNKKDGVEFWFELEIKDL